MGQRAGQASSGYRTRSADALKNCPQSSLFPLAPTYRPAWKPASNQKVRPRNRLEAPGGSDTEQILVPTSIPASPYLTLALTPHQSAHVPKHLTAQAQHRMRFKAITKPQEPRIPQSTLQHKHKPVCALKPLRNPKNPRIPYRPRPSRHICTYSTCPALSSPLPPPLSHPRLPSVPSTPVRIPDHHLYQSLRIHNPPTHFALSRYLISAAFVFLRLRQTRCEPLRLWWSGFWWSPPRALIYYSPRWFFRKHFLLLCAFGSN